MKNLLLTLVSLSLLTQPGWSGVIFNEPFDYPDGILTVVSDGIWARHSGTANQLVVDSGKALLSHSRSEDVSVQLLDGPYDGPTLYASFVVNFSSLPRGAGSYFAHFKGATTTFRCRVYASTNGAGSDRFRVGITSGSGEPVMIPRDLELATDYLLVLRYNTGTPASTLWLEPSSETTSEHRADTIDSPSATPITSFSLRQAGSNPGIGILTLDDLRVGTEFDDVVVSGFSLAIDRLADEISVSWPAAAEGYRLQTNDSYDAAGWVDVPDVPEEEGDRMVVRSRSVTGHLFFRLIHD